MAGAAVELITTLATVPGMGYAGAALGVAALGVGFIAVVRLAIRDMAREAMEASIPKSAPIPSPPSMPLDMASEVGESGATPESKEVCESV